MLLRISICLNITDRLYSAFFCLILLFSSLRAAAADRVEDEFLTGYVASIPEFLRSRQI